MPLEYIFEVDRPFILMYSRDLVHWQFFHSAIVELLQGKIKSFSVHELPGWEGVSGCQLVAKMASRDTGLRKVGELEFECNLTRIWWDNCEMMVASFMEGDDWETHRHQYFVTPGIELELDWCLSSNREW